MCLDFGIPIVSSFEREYHEIIADVCFLEMCCPGFSASIPVDLIPGKCNWRELVVLYD